MMNTVTMVPRSTNRAPVGKEVRVGLRLGLGVGGKNGGCVRCIRRPQPQLCPLKQPNQLQLAARTALHPGRAALPAHPRW